MLEKVENEQDVIKVTKEVIQLFTNIAEKTSTELINKIGAEKLKRAPEERSGSGIASTQRARPENKRSDLTYLELFVFNNASDSGVEIGSTGKGDSSRSASTTLAPFWEKKKDLGKGAFGVVYSAVDKNGQEFAVKEVPIGGDKEKSLRGEIEFLRDLAHRNIVRFFAYAGNKEKLCMCMELMQGSLRDVINKTGKPISETMARRHTRDLLQGLIYLHGEKVIHRDIKCANVLLNSTGVAKLGTLPWMSPEVLRGDEGGRRSDVWSVGCTVFEMTKGQAPFVEETQPNLSDLSGKILRLEHKKLVDDDDSFEPAIKNFLMGIFVEINKRQYAEHVAEHLWVK